MLSAGRKNFYIQTVSVVFLWPLNVPPPFIFLSQGLTCWSVKQSTGTYKHQTNWAGQKTERVNVKWKVQVLLSTWAQVIIFCRVVFLFVLVFMTMATQVPETCMLKAVDRSITHITAHQYCFIKLFYNFDESYMHVLIVHKYFQHPRVSHT